MPTYNAADHVSEAISSILNQTFEDLELLIVDDGSTDGTLERIHSFDDNRIRLFERTDCQGVTSARNFALERAKGEYIACQDADDRSKPERLEHQYRYLEDHKDVGLLGTGAYLVDDSGSRISRRRVPEAVSFENLLEHNHFIHGSTMYRQSAAKAVGGYDEFFPVAEDFDFYLRLASEYPLRNIDDPLYLFRIHSGSLYESKSRETKLYHQFAIRQATDGVDDEIQTQISDEGIERFYAEMTDQERLEFHAEMARELLRYGSLERARNHTQHLRRLDATRASPHGLHLLTYTSPLVVSGAVKLYRLLINTSIAIRNNK